VQTIFAEIFARCAGRVHARETDRRPTSLALLIRHSDGSPVAQARLKSLSGRASRLAVGSQPRGKERKMLSVMLGMLAMVPVVFGVAGYVMVSR